MKKEQAIKLWKNLADSTNVKQIISSFENKKGYSGKYQSCFASKRNTGLLFDLGAYDSGSSSGCPRTTCLAEKNGQTASAAWELLYA